MRGIKIPQQDFVLKMQGGLCARGGGGGGGAYLRDTTIHELTCEQFQIDNIYYISTIKSCEHAAITHSAQG